MAWLTLISLLLKVASAIMRAVERKGVVDGATAKAVLASLRKTSAFLDKALAARREVRDNPDGEYARKLREQYTLKSPSRDGKSK